MSEVHAGSRIARHLAHAIGQSKYKLWFHSALIRVGNGMLDVAVPNKFVADWIDSHFHDQLLAVAEAELGEGAAVTLRVDPACAAVSTATAKPKPDEKRLEAAAKEATEAAEKADESAAESSTPPGREPGADRQTPTKSGANGRRQPPYNRPEALKYKLSDFVIGPSNELAVTAACRLIDGPHDQLNMLFLHGGCGLGKTHLLQGICRRFAELRPSAQWCYTTAEQFTNEFIAAVRGGRLREFRRTLRRLDLLAIDDVHFLADKKATQTEFLHTFDAIDLHGSKLVMASDAHPKLIREFSDALISRLMSAMVAQINPPDRETRARIIYTLAQRRGIHLTPAAIQSLAMQRAGSVREIEGMLSKLTALGALSGTSGGNGSPVGQSLVDRLISPSADGLDSRPVRLDQIMHTVCDHLGVERAAIMTKSRHRRVVLARSVGIFLARQLTTLSYPELARALDRPNHSTIVTAAQRIERQIHNGEAVTISDPSAPVTMDQLVQQLRRRVLEAANQAGR